MSNIVADSPVFLGVRVDVSTQALPDAYANLEQRINAVVEAYRGDADEEAALNRLAQLKLSDEHGNVWTVGAGTGRWMVKPSGGKRWQPGHPSLGVG